MKFLLKSSATLGFLAALVSAHALTLDTSGSIGDLTFDDGLGNSGFVSIEHISSTASELDFLVDDLEVYGRTVVRADDLDGTIVLNRFGVTEYGYNTVGHRILGMSWDFNVDNADISSYSHLLYNNVTSPNGDFVSKEYNDPNEPTFPFNPEPDYTDGLHVSGNYGWWMEDPSYTDVRYALVGYVDSSNGSIVIADGVKMTLNATIAPALVPEPASMAILGVGALGLLRKRRR